MESSSNKSRIGKRVVVFEHLNLLLKVFENRSIMTEDDFQGFSSWANSWYPNCTYDLKNIFYAGDSFSLDFIIWLRDIIFPQRDFASLFGSILENRLREHIDINNNEGKDTAYSDLSGE